jgi:RHS repeat-associated protein
MPAKTYAYDLDGAMISASGEPFSQIQRHHYTRLPVLINGSGGDVASRYDSYGRRLHKAGAHTVLYRNGAHHPTPDRTKSSEKGNGVHHVLVEHVDGAEIVYLFTPVGQSVMLRAGAHTRVGRDHLRSVRTEASLPVAAAAHYSAFGESIVTGGQLRRGFAGYELDAEIGLYNACRRLYAPWLRIFVSVDPRLQNASPYPYCGGDPFNRVDPTGAVSSSVINAIVSALLMVVAIIVTIATEGAASETIPLAGADLSGEAAGEGASEGLGAAIAKSMPSAVNGFAKFGAGFGAASSVVGNGAGLAAKAANGEHVTAWQAIRGMLIEPIVAAASGGIGGGIAGLGLVEGQAALRVFGFAAIGAAAGSMADCVINTAVGGQLAMRSSWDSIGIQMAVAVGEGMMMAPFFMRIHVPLGEPENPGLFRRMGYGFRRPDRSLRNFRLPRATIEPRPYPYDSGSGAGVRGAARQDYYVPIGGSDSGHAPLIIVPVNHDTIFTEGVLSDDPAWRNRIPRGMHDFADEAPIDTWLDIE